MTSRTYLRLGVALWALTAIFALLPSWPYIYYRLSPGTSNQLANTIAQTTSPRSSENSTRFPSPYQGEGSGVRSKPTPTDPLIYRQTETPKLPMFDPGLPRTNGLIIPKIGVRGQIHEGTDWQSILKQGIWRVPSFATPRDIVQRDTVSPSPIILAAHRWGYLDWSAAFRKLNSFYNLPKLAVGDTIEIIWEQRKYEYKVYSVTTGTEVPEYNANLILYTCQLWNSPIRFFVLANRSN